MAKQPKAEVEVTASSRGLKSKLAGIGGQFKKAGKGWRESLFGKSKKEDKEGKAGALGEFAGNMTARAVTAAGDFLAKQAQDVRDYNNQITRLKILSGKSAEEMDAYSRSVRTASDVTGISQAQVLEAGRAYVTLTGDMNTAQGKALEWAKVAQATESTAADIAATAAAMKQNLNIDSSETADAFGVLSQQGKAGAIELKDLAQQLANIAPQWAMFKGGTGLQGLKEMGAALQIAKRGFGGDASETVTGVQGLLTALIKNSSRFKKGGVKIFDVGKDGTKTMRNVFDIIDDITNSKLIKDPHKLEKAFGRVEAYRAFLQLSKNNAELKAMARNAGSAADIERDFAEYMNSDSGKAAKNWQDALNSVKEAFTPERIAVFTEAVTGMVSALASLVGGIGAALAGVKAIAEGAAIVFGGERQETRAARAQLKRREERRKWLGDFAEKRSGGRVGMADREKFINNSLLEEDVLAANLRDQIAGKSISRPKFDQSYNFLGDKGDFSISELMQLRTKTQTNTSDSAVFGQLIDQLLAKQGPVLVRSFRQALQDAVDNPTMMPTVKVGADTIAKAAKTAPANRRRPGG